VSDLLRRFNFTPANLGLFFVLFAVTLVLSVAVAAFILVQAPPDAFEEKRRPPGPMWKRILKNAVGAALVALGIVLSVPGVPGQGLLTILVGLMLVDGPGKRPLERWILRKGAVLRAINRLRNRFGKEPLREPRA
jgi:hypothetical protein